MKQKKCIFNIYINRDIGCIGFYCKTHGKEAKDLFIDCFAELTERLSKLLNKVK